MASLRPMPTLLAILTMSGSSLELIMDMVMYLDMELLVTGAMLAMEAMLAMVVSMVATEVTMASVKLTLMLTPLARLPTDSLRPMPTLLAILTMLGSSLELIMDMVMYLDMELLVTVAMLAMVVSMVATLDILEPSMDKHFLVCNYSVISQLLYLHIVL